ncbi:MAG: cysteine--tRNA ligase, partial [Pseudomonadota bacterium]
MTIRLYNSATRAEVDFTPLKKGQPSMYVCGPTVYDRAHLGNARPVVVFDVLYRLLRYEYEADNVTYVRNFTDVDDKINAKAVETGRPIREITDETIAWFHEDMGALGVLQPNHMPRATEYIAQMIAMIAELEAKGLAYAAEGHVLFRVDKYEGYGALSGRSVDDMIAGARVEVAPYKENPMDFVLWKPSDGDAPGWESPWGYGRPGWHIECSAMARDILGDKFDIHGGGLDLQFPHHENEIAQSKACCGSDSFAQIWIHNEMLQVEGKKMSKSLGNFFTVRDLLERGIPGPVIRFAFLNTHYSKPMDWTDEKAAVFADKLNDVYISQIEKFANLDDLGDSNPSEELIEALKDDLNTSLAITHLERQVSSSHGT